MQSVPLLDVLRGNLPLKGELMTAFERVLCSGGYILGEDVAAFEKECQDYIGAPHALAVSSGTDALLLALMALNVGPGDEVICPTYTFFATAGAIWRTGAKPVFVDSEPVTFNLDPDDVVRKLSPKTKAIIPVHLFGQCAAMDRILEIANAHGVPVIEDAAQALSACYGDKQAGTLGVFGCYSFFPSKNLGGFGDGGLLTINDSALHERANLLRRHGGGSGYKHDIVGGNFRMDTVQAALLRVKLPHLDAYSQARQNNAQRYNTLFVDAGVAQMPAADATPQDVRQAGRDHALVLPVARESKHIYNQYVVRVRDLRTREALLADLKAAQIGCAVYYPIPMHLQACFAGLNHHVGDFPVAEEAAQTSLAIPVYPELTASEQERVVDVVVKSLKSQ